MNFILPDHEHLRTVNFQLLELKSQHPEWFQKNRNIFSFYGVLTNSPADGGRPIQAYNPSAIIKAIIQDYQHFGAQFAHVLSNDFITESEFKDSNLTKILTIANEYGNPVILTNIPLSLYIKEHYTSIPRVGSIIRLDDLDMTIDLLKNNTFDFCVINPKYNYNLDLIPEDYRPHSVVLANDCCPNDCPNKKICYEKTFRNSWENSIEKIDWGRYFWTTGKGTGCSNQIKMDNLRAKPDAWGQSFEGFQELRGVINPQDYQIFDDLNIGYIKIEGRTRPPIQNAFLYAKIFAKPEYYERVLYDLVNGTISGLFTSPLAKQ